jgi:hypothetical protein
MISRKFVWSSFFFGSMGAAVLTSATLSRLYDFHGLTELIYNLGLGVLVGFCVSWE